MFAKRHYQAVAGVIQQLALSNEECSPDELLTLDTLRLGIAAEFATMFAKDNPKFNRGKFINACMTPAYA